MAYGTGSWGAYIQSRKNLCFTRAFSENFVPPCFCRSRKVSKTRGLSLGQIEAVISGRRCQDGVGTGGKTLEILELPVLVSPQDGKSCSVPQAAKNNNNKQLVSALDQLLHWFSGSQTVQTDLLLKKNVRKERF